MPNFDGCGFHQLRILSWLHLSSRSSIVTNTNTTLTIYHQRRMWMTFLGLWNDAIDDHDTDWYKFSSCIANHPQSHHHFASSPPPSYAPHPLALSSGEMNVPLDDGGRIEGLCRLLRLSYSYWKIIFSFTRIPGCGVRMVIRLTQSQSRQKCPTDPVPRPLSDATE